MQPVAIRHQRPNLARLKACEGNGQAFYCEAVMAF